MADDRHEPSKQPGREGPPVETAEERILREGEAARLALARRTAREALAEPGVLDAKRLSRLGPDGLARFAAELCQLALGTRQPPVAPSSSTRQGSSLGKADRRSTDSANASAGAVNRPAGAVRRAAATRPAAPAFRRAKFAGWWQWQKDNRARFEVRAWCWGAVAGLIAILAGLAWLALTHH